MGQSQVHRADARRRILVTARELFLRDGIRNVTMADVALHSGFTRQMIYKVFFGRRELVQAAAVKRIEEIADAYAAGTARETADPSTAVPFSTSFVEISVNVIETLRNDPELETLFGEGSPVTRYEALWAPELTERALVFWQPWLDWGRKEHLLRDDLSDRDLADWLHTVYASIILRQNIPPDKERSMIERFVLTSLTMATVTA